MKIKKIEQVAQNNDENKAKDGLKVKTRVVVKTLVNMGLRREQVKSSTPLVSTRTVGLLMRKMFEDEPASVLLMAALVEAQEFREDGIEDFKQRMHELYDLPLSTFDPFFEHQKVDVGMGHAEAVRRQHRVVHHHRASSTRPDREPVTRPEHAFELQTLEIKAYYADQEGKYFPSQPMPFSSL